MMASVSLVLLVCVNALGGALYGVSCGVQPIYMFFNQQRINCSIPTTQHSCAASDAAGAGCLWDSATTSCVFGSGFRCGALATKDACLVFQNESCTFDSASHTCQESFGWSAALSGLFVGAVFVGAAVGSCTASRPLKLLGFRRTMLLIGVVSVVASSLTLVAHSVSSYPFLLVTRVFVGISMGLGTVACTLYVGENAPPHLKLKLGLVFQVSICFFIAFVAGVGLGIQPTDFGLPLAMDSRIYSVLAIQVAVGFLFIPLWWVMPKASSEGGDVHGAKEQQSLVAHTAATGDGSGNEFPLRAKLNAVFLSMALQNTGINAIIAFSPSITAAIGLQPLMGNFLTMLWSLLCTGPAVPLLQKYGPRRLYIWGTVLVSSACVLTAVPTFPGVASQSVQGTLCAIGIALYLLAFQAGVGCPFYLLSTVAFERHYRDKAASLTQLMGFAFLLLVVALFPVAVQAFSGGPSGNQNQGLAIVFLVFAGMGFSSAGVLGKTLPSDEEMTRW